MVNKKLQKIFKVRGCYDCPYLRKVPMEGFDCLYPDSIVPKDKIGVHPIHVKENSLPKLCPLRIQGVEETMLVELDDMIREIQ